MFVGSSTEGLQIAQQIQAELLPIRSKVWKQGTFKLGESGLHSLVDELSYHDFAILVFSPDDITSSRDSTLVSPRDNVVFELGLFMGRLGPQRTFVLYDQTADLKILSDLSGLTLAPYDGRWAKLDLAAAIGAACNPIRQAIRLSGPIQKPLVQVESPSFLLASALNNGTFENELSAIISSGIRSPHTERNLNADRLRTLLSSKPYDIVQLTVDVSTGGDIGFYDRDASSAAPDGDRIPAEGLVNLLEASKTSLLILASCDSVPLAARLSSRVNMIAASGTLRSDLFHAWACTFYRLLVAGEPLSYAFKVAESTVRLPLSVILHQDVQYRF